MSNNIFSNTHDELYSMADSCVKLIDYSDMQKINNVFVISVIEEARLKTFLNGLFEVNPNIKVSVLVQDYVYEGFNSNFGEKCKVYSWKGGYSLEVLKTIDVMDSLDSFVFFSDFPMNLRDKNYLEIGKELTNSNDARVFCCTIGNDIYEVNNISYYYQCLKVYEEMGKLAEEYAKIL